MELELTTDEHGYNDYAVFGHPTVKRVCIPFNIEIGDIFNTYHIQGRKTGTTWLGDIESSIKASNIIAYVYSYGDYEHGVLAYTALVDTGLDAKSLANRECRKSLRESLITLYCELWREPVFIFFNDEDLHLR